MKPAWPIFLVLLLVAAPTTVQAQFGYMTNANNTNTVTITNYSGPGGAVAIPATISNLLVTGIGEGAFFDRTTLTSVTIGDGITSIGEGAFDSCYNLTNVTIPGSITDMGDYAFAGCINLASAVISNGVATIGQDVFENCFKLASVTIPDSVTNIGNYAFYNCNGLTNMAIPRNVKSIGDGPFAGCVSLTVITVDAQNLYYSSTNGALFNKSQTMLVQYPGGVGGNYTIPDSVTSIGNYAFDYCYMLTSVTIPDSVTNIGNDAFFNCSSLTTAAMSSCLSNIGQDAFFGCALTRVTIPGSVTNIGEDAFQDCTGLTNVYFTGNAPSADSSVFVSDNAAVVYYLPRTTGWSTNFGGAPARLWNPLIQADGANFGVRSNQFGFNITGTNNFTVVVEVCTNLGSPVWTPLQTVTLTNGSYYFIEPLQTSGFGRFYGLGLP